MKVAEVLIQTLVEAGVKRIYGVAGDSLNGLTETIRKSKNIEWLHVRHEEVAAFTAGADAHITSEIAVCAGSCGPGNLEVMVNRQELSMPPTISVEQALGFSLYMIRAVMNGRGDEIIDLAKTNLFP